MPKQQVTLPAYPVWKTAYLSWAFDGIVLVIPERYRNTCPENPHPPLFRPL